MANDVVGFQTYDHCHNFIATCLATVPEADGNQERMILRYQGRTIRVRPYPISLDVTAVRQVAAGETVANYRNVLRDFLGERTILRVDRAGAE